MNNPRCKALSRVSAALAFALTLGAPLTSSAEVVINEIGAASNDRLLRSHADGRPRLGWGPSWCALAFDDSDWETGSAPFGFGHDGIATNLEDPMLGRTPSLYLRKTFTVSPEDAARAEPFSLTAQADSGFLAFVNGHEIARANLGRLNGFVYRGQSAFSSAESDTSLTYVSPVLARDVLRPGENVFAVQVQNTVPSQINERDTSIDPSLKFQGSLALGLVEDGSATPIELPDTTWRYRVGHAEPSGGVVDWTQVAHPGVEGDFSDWIELHNTGGETVDLTGWHLTDDADQPDLWSFPDTTIIPAGGYLLILADGNTEVPGDYLHASFALSADGEFLGLSNAQGEFVSQFAEGFPPQQPFHSYGLSAQGEANYRFFAEPSPGAPNAGPELAAAVQTLAFDPAGGVHDDTLTLSISTGTEGAQIRYTLDGSEPSKFHGTVYEGPLTIGRIDDRTGTPVRARAFRTGMVPSAETTQTYLIGLDPVFKTIPSVSLVADGNEAFYQPHGILSIVGLNVPQKVSDYYMPAMHGRAFERKVSMEVLFPDDGTNIQINGGLRISASAFSRGSFFLGRTEESPWESRHAEKPSFNLFFRQDYGDGTLNFPLVENYPVRQFHQFRLRAGKNDIVNPWVTDEMARRVFTDTGQFGSVGIQHALFINGSYKGYYNTVARLREKLFQDRYDSDHPWQVKHIDVWADGSPHDNALRDTPEWDHLESLLSKDLRVLENYQAVVEELDPINFADYFIVNLYGATWDWPHNNLVIARELSENGRWRAYLWDAEGIFGVQGGHSLAYDSIVSDLNDTERSPSNDLATVWTALIRSPEWRLLFADRLQKHFFTPGGALTRANLTRRLEELATEITPLMAFAGGPTMDTSQIVEWIAARQDVLFTTGGYWEPHKLWGQAQVPVFTPSGGTVAAGTPLTISVEYPFPPGKTGLLYYTTDGSDPRLPGGQPNPAALRFDPDPDNGLVLQETTTIRSRVNVTTLFDSAGTWGALQESTFRVGLEPARSHNFRISELLVDPQSASASEEAANFSAAQFEYIEFYNASDVAIDLTDLRFTAGIQYVFGEGDATTLAPRAYGVIVNDRAAFVLRHGAGLPILGQYNKKLRNDGELLEISDATFATIVSLTYGADAPWPSNPKDEGRSLVFTPLAAGGDPNDPANWISSAIVGGTPGRARDAGPPEPQPASAYTTWKAAQFTVEEQANAAIVGPSADPDGDGAGNLVEFAMGTDPKQAQSVPAIAIQLETSLMAGEPESHSTITIHITERSDGAVHFTPEHSADLKTWQAVSPGDLVETDSQPAGAGLRRVAYRMAHSKAAYLRWRLELAQP